MLDERDFRVVLNWLAHDLYIKARAPQPPSIPLGANLLMHGGRSTIETPYGKKIHVEYNLKMASDPRLLNVVNINVKANLKQALKQKRNLALALEKKLNAKPWDDYILVDKKMLMQIIEALKQ